MYSMCYVCTVKFVFSQDDSGYMQFLKKSYGDILKEQERRHRFLAEKHCSLIQSIAQLMNKVHSYH